MMAFFLALAALIVSVLPTPALRPPPANAAADYQLGGAYTPQAGVTVVMRDRTEKTASGLYNICYVNAFQTQPGERSWWENNHPSLLLRSAKGKLIGDPDWPDEFLLDIRTAAKRRELAGIVGTWFKGCAASGYKAVEPDNLDSWTRSHGLLKLSDTTAFARTMVASAHSHGLAIAQKNAAELIGSRIGFDFAVTEECEVHRECAAYLRRFGDHVIEVEYTDNGRTAYRRACSTHGRSISVLRRDRDLVTNHHRNHVYEAC